MTLNEQALEDVLRPPEAYIGRVALDGEVIQAWARHARLAGAKVRVVRRIVSVDNIQAIIFVAIVRPGLRGDR